ncbi:MAG TPA: hypothetical protein VFO82_00735, partial [Steroidobacteraceae bacterium]|nr:hypothetical protein [Steroidobacteraceae bacterium]
HRNDQSRWIAILAPGPEWHGREIRRRSSVSFHKVTARLEYERPRFSGDAADTWSLGVAYSFR